MRWSEEIDGLHAFFVGTESSLDRVEAVLAPDFSIVGPHGVESDRETTMQMLRDGHAHTTHLSITTSDHRLLLSTEETIVATYVEQHQLRDRQNRRLTTVVFIPDAAAPNGLLWSRAHETWLTSEEAQQ